MAKYEKTERLEKVPMEYLWEGLVLSDNLYNYNGSVLLVPSGEVITKSKLDKLINFSDGNNYITTFRGSYEYIMKGKDRPETKEHGRFLLRRLSADVLLMRNI